MKLSEIFNKFKDTFISKFSHSLFYSQRKTLESIIKCRTSECGSMIVQCPACKTFEWKNHSCKNRHCPKCQNHDGSHWLNKEQMKLLPVNYFLVTFTVPKCLRKAIWMSQNSSLEILFKTSSQALTQLAKDPRHYGGKIGMTAVMHLHSKKLNFHPHIHYLIPNGAIDTFKRLWKSKNSKFFLPTKPLEKLFKGKCLDAFKENKISFPKSVYSQKWIINVQEVGSGLPTLKYLARYLYRGVLNEDDVTINDDHKVVLKYKDRINNRTSCMTFQPDIFMLKYLRLTFPHGFRRTRSFGFLHGNAFKTLGLVQLVLKMKLSPLKKIIRPVFKCSVCSTAMIIVCPMIKKTIPNPLMIFNKGST